MKARAVMAATGAVATVVALWWWTAAARPELPWWRRYTPAVLLADLALSALVLCGSYMLAAAPAMRRVRLLRVAVACGAFALALGALELPAVLGRDWGDWLCTADQRSVWALTLRTNRPDPDLIHRHRAFEVFESEVAGNLVGLGIDTDRRYPVSIRYDHNGFRNDRDLRRADLVVIGDSFVEAALVPAADSLTARLERTLGEVTANLGQIAYGPQQERIVLERYGLPLRPRQVVWCVFGGNDLVDATNYDVWLRAGKPDVARPRRLWDRLLLTNLPRALARRLTAPGPEIARRHSGVLRSSGERVWFKDTEGDYDPAALELLLDALAGGQRACRAAGVALLVLYVPRKFRVYRDYCDFEPGACGASWRLNDLPRRLGRWCAEHGIAFVDTTAALRARVAAGVHPYFVDDVHWNREGHAVAARLCCERLR